MASNVLVHGRNPSGQSKPLGIDAHGNLRVNASVTIPEGSMARGTDITALSSAITSKLSTFSKSTGSDALKTSITSFYTATGVLLDDVNVFSPGDISSVVDIRGCAHVNIFYQDSFAPTRMESMSRGLYIELSPQAPLVEPKEWHCHELLLSPSEATDYPGIGSGRIASYHHLYVAGYQTMRLRHQMKTRSTDLAERAEEDYTDCSASFVGSSV